MCELDGWMRKHADGKDADETVREEGDIYRCSRVEKIKWLISSERNAEERRELQQEHNRFANTKTGSEGNTALRLCTTLDTTRHNACGPGRPSKMKD